MQHGFEYLIQMETEILFIVILKLNVIDVYYRLKRTKSLWKEKNI